MMERSVIQGSTWKHDINVQYLYDCQNTQHTVPEDVCVCVREGIFLSQKVDFCIWLIIYNADGFSILKSRQWFPGIHCSGDQKCCPSIYQGAGLFRSFYYALKAQESLKITLHPTMLLSESPKVQKPDIQIKYFSNKIFLLFVGPFS